MRSNTIGIIAILVIGSLFGVAYSASTVISNTGITTPSLTVTTPGGCTGCGGSEGTFTHWTTVLVNTTLGASAFGANWIVIDNNGNSMAQDKGSDIFFVGANGTTLLSESTTARDKAGSSFAQSSITGKYQIIFDTTTSKVNVYNNGTLVSTINNNSIAANTATIGISPNGKYIEIFGENGLTNDRLMILEGS